MLDYRKTTIELFDLQVMATPHVIAIRNDKQEITYNQLNEKVNQLANWLINHNVSQGDIIALLLEPSVELIICVLASIKLGAIYLPIDVQFPEQRINSTLLDAQPKIVITIKQYNNLTGFNVKLINNLTKLAEVYSKTYPNAVYSPESPICMFYTSGSTGSPKGVLISHQAVVNLNYSSNFFNIGPGDTIIQFSNVAFDAVNFEIWAALLNGATVLILPKLVKQDYQLVKKRLTYHNISCIFLPTAYLNQVINIYPELLDSIETILFGGELVNSQLIRKFLEYRRNLQLKTRVIHVYGPTETTTFACYNVIDITSNEDVFASIGKPIDNMQTYVLDENLRELPIGKVGELYISGIGLAIGYNHAPELTQERFIPNHFCDKPPFTRLYRTGDMVKLLPTGELLYMGRLDDQVKINGYRINLSEIEQKLLTHPAIAFAAVMAEQVGDSHKLLTAYISFSTKDVTISAEKIKAFLVQELPFYMIPSKYLRVENMPLTNVGKVNKRHLKDISHIDLAQTPGLSSFGFIEEKLKSIWRYLLNHDGIDVHRNLFELGANSLIITTACSLINKEFNSALTVSKIMEYPSIYKLGLYIEGGEQALKMVNKLNNGALDVAIIGMACKFPQANNVQEFWSNICNGRDCLTNFGMTSEPENMPPNFVPIKGIIENIDKFDAKFFGFNPSDASFLDPQQRLFLECAWEALEFSGNKVNSDKIISVFAGMADSSYLQENLLKNNLFRQKNDWFNTRVATSIGTLSTKISYHLNLRGKSLNINTACSTGLVAVDQACQDLVTGNSDIAMAGGVSIDLHQRTGYLYQENGIESIDGKCRPFSDEASGTVFSDGVGVVVLKRLEDAVHDNDTIYAVVKGCGVNNDGKDKVGYVAPGMRGQSEAIHKAILQSQVNPENIGFIEGHGTATSLGDLIEVDALNEAYKQFTHKTHYCVLGSVKGNIGHTDISAGIAGLIKATLCLYYKKIPPTINFIKPNPNIDFINSPFFVNTKLLDWNSNLGGYRYAGVSAFGVGGTNAHIVLEEYGQNHSQPGVFQNQLLIFSGKSKPSLHENKLNLTKYLANEFNKKEPNNLSDIAYTLQTGREAFQWRSFVVGSQATTVIQDIANSSSLLSSDKDPNSVVFMFSGQGTQYQKMAMQLIEHNPYFASVVAECNDIIKQYLDHDITTIINEHNLINQTQYTQPALFTIEYALTKLFMSYNILPAALIGHSIGEYVAACISGIFTLEDAISLICKRGTLMAKVNKGEMLAIECTKEDFLMWVGNMNVGLALHNSFHSCVAAGLAEDISKLQRLLDSKGIAHKKLKVSHAFHSYLMDEICEVFKGYASEITLSTPQIPLISNLTGTWLTDIDAISPNYWSQHLRHTVLFKDGIETLVHEGYSIFVEIGPGHTLCSFAKETIGKDLPKYCITSTLPSHSESRSDEFQLLTAIGALWQYGLNIDWLAFYGDEKRLHIPLPTYSFQRQRYWIEPDKFSNNTGLNVRNDISEWFFKPDWILSQDWLSKVEDIPEINNYEWIVFANNVPTTKLIVQTIQQLIPTIKVISQAPDYSKIDNGHYEININEKDHYIKVFKDLKTELQSPIIILNLLPFQEYNDFMTSKEVDLALNQTFWGLLYIVQAYIEINTDTPLRCLNVTIGSQKVFRTDKISPVNASLTGICRVTPQEHPLLKLQLLDLQNILEPPIIQGVINYCINGDWDSLLNPITAIRDNYQYQLTYNNIKLNRSLPRVPNNGVYLITGGLGGISLALCEKIALTALKPVFILISRSEIPPEEQWDQIINGQPHNKLGAKLKILTYLKSLGAILQIENGDIGKFDSVDRIVNKVMSQHGKINGVIHAAGVAGGGLIQLKTKDQAYNVLQPKIHGTYNLARALRNNNLDFVVLCSSISALVGESGQVDYCGANACLDAFAASNIFKSKLTVSINWNTWQLVGMAVETERPEDITYFDRDNDITPTNGQDLFMQILNNQYSNVAISKYDLVAFSKVMAEQNKIDAPTLSKTPRDDLDLDDEYLAPSNLNEEKMVRLWQDSLGIDQIGITDDFFNLGGHSLKALRLIEGINKTFSSNLTLQDLYENRTILKLVTRIVKSSNSNNIVVPLKSVANATKNIFFIHPVGGMIFCYNNLVSQWDLPFNIYGLQDPSIITGKIEYSSLHELAELYLQEIRKIQPEGPYYLVGYSFGGTIAYEIANLIYNINGRVGMLALIEGWALFSPEQDNENMFKNMMHQYSPELSEQFVNLSWQRMKLLLNHQPTKTGYNIILFKSTQMLGEYQSISDEFNGWQKFNNGCITVHRIESNHETIVDAQSSSSILNLFHRYLINS